MRARTQSAGSKRRIFTSFNDYEGWKASNPVVSTDGRNIAFQIAHTVDEAGVGYGIVIMKILR